MEDETSHSIDSASFTPEYVAGSKRCVVPGGYRVGWSDSPSRVFPLDPVADRRSTIPFDVLNRNDDVQQLRERCSAMSD